MYIIINEHELKQTNSSRIIIPISQKSGYILRNLVIGKWVQMRKGQMDKYRSDKEVGYNYCALRV